MSTMSFYALLAAHFCGEWPTPSIQTRGGEVVAPTRKHGYKATGRADNEVVAATRSTVTKQEL